MSEGKLVILSGPSGVGKDTVIDLWRKSNPRVTRVVAYATRPARPNEVSGIDYQFVTKEQFLKMAEEGHFLEHKEVYGNYYATPLTDLEAILKSGGVAVLKIDVQGALTVMDLRSDAISVFIRPPSEDELLRRIQSRGTEEGEVLEKRIRNAQAEIAQSHRYQHQIVNQDLSTVIQKLEAIINA